MAVLRLGARVLVAALIAGAGNSCQGSGPEPDSEAGSSADVAAPPASTHEAPAGSSAEPLVATVGDYAVDAEHFRQGVLRLSGDEAKVADLSLGQRRQILGALIDLRLVALEADRRGLAQDSAVTIAVADAERAAVNDAMYRLEVEEQVEITPEDIREQYVLWGEGEVIEPAHILLATRGAADSVLAELASGADFAELARTRSIHGGSSVRGGSMGFLRKFLIPDRLRRHIWDLPAGALYPEPIPTMMGYHVVEIRRRGHQTMEQQEKAITGFLRRKRRAIAERDLHARLQGEYGYNYRAETVTRLVRQGPSASGDSVLARWRGGELTLAQFRARASGPNASSTDTARIRKLISDLSAEEIIHREGLTRGWGSLPEVSRPVEEALLRALGEALFASLRETDPTAEEVAAFYDTHRDSYRGPDRVSVQEILVDEAETADSLHALILAGADMAALARRHSIREETRQAGGIWEDVEKYEPTSATVYRRAREGEGLLEPVPLPSGGHSVIRVMGVGEGRILDLAEAGETVREDIQAVAMDSVITGLRRQYRSRVSIDDGALGQVE